MALFTQLLAGKTLTRAGIQTTSRWFCTKSNNEQQSQRPKTGIVMMNMGGPADPKDTKDFLSRLFNDPEIITLGGGKFQQFVANQIVSRRSPKVEKQYETIGGSPILKWTQFQGNEMCQILNSKYKAEEEKEARFKPYVMFRYAEPLTESTLMEMKNDGIEHAIAFSQYPQWCCNTTGSSMNHLWRELERLNLTNSFEWSIIDRWYLHDGYINALCDRIETTLNEKGLINDDNTIILFSAHSIPMKSVKKGDPYVFEVSATVKQVMARLSEKMEHAPPFQLAWQSKVGPLEWMVPSTEHVIKSIGKNKRYSNVVVVPFVFTSDHIETLYELDIEYGNVAKELGISNYIRCPALNDSKIFINALADIVNDHLTKGHNHSNQYKLRCHDCTNEMCRTIQNPKFNHSYKPNLNQYNAKPV